MMSLRLCALFFLALAGSAVAKERTPRLPYLVAVYNYGSMSCSGAVVSSNTILVPIYCIMSTSPMDVKVRFQDTPINDSGEIYRITRILYDSQEDLVDTMNKFALLRLDRDIDGGYGHKSPSIPKGDVVVPEGTVCNTVRRSYASSSSYYWTLLNHQSVQVISDAKCKEAYPDTWTNEFICVGAIDPTGESPNNECQGETGAPLVCGDELVAINSCEISCYGQICAYRRLSAFGDFIRQL